MSSFHFTEDGMEDYLYWQTHDKQTLRKINSLLKSVSRTPFSGEGKRTITARNFDLPSSTFLHRIVFDGILFMKQQDENGGNHR